ncbi:MAG: ribosome silencing factor [Flavobacteriaceae bacterium]|nr:ribosome silencing factor [Flavobacteriaceae bacterium]|tara:strand:- start:180 stop:551 length:372 start_codon:yes stop_codon:yes gene_type:complete
MTKNTPSSDNLIGLIIQGMEDIKGEDISILDLRNIENTVCDYFIICDGSSNIQVNSIISSINKVVRRGIKEKPYQIEGIENSEWVLMDYIDVVVHVFKKEKRGFYDIESLWGDAIITKIKSSY